MEIFCNTLVKQQFHALGISPDFRILDDSERRAMEEDAVSECVAELYNQGGEVFENLTDLFLLGSSDRDLKDTVLQLYAYAQAHPFPEAWLSAIASAYNPDNPLTDTLWGKEICRYLSAQLAENQRILKNALQLLEQEPPLAEKYTPAFASDLQYARTIADALAKNEWDTVKTLLAEYTPEKLGAAPRAYADSSLKTTVTAIRDKVKKSLREGMPKYLHATTAEHKRDMQYLQPNDALLCETAALAVESSEKYEDILLDEKPDTNEAQDMLFSAISREGHNLFTVGDVKQSIYGFRLAMPEIFMRRREQYADFDGKTYPARITLDKNFRSRKNVADGINYLFGQLMTKDTCGIDYSETERLNPAAPFDAAEDECVELHLLTGAAQDEDGNFTECHHIPETDRTILDSKKLLTD